MDDWKQAHADAASAAIDHPLVVSVIQEYLGNLGIEDRGLPAYGVRKVAAHAAQVARAQALGLDPELLRLTPEEALSVQLRIAAGAVNNGVPTTIIEPSEDTQD